MTSYGHESVGDEEDEERQIADGMLRQVDARSHVLSMGRRGSAQEQGKYWNGQRRQSSAKTQHRHRLSTKQCDSGSAGQ